MDVTASLKRLVKFTNDAFCAPGFSPWGVFGLLVQSLYSRESIQFLFLQF